MEAPRFDAFAEGVADGLPRRAALGRPAVLARATGGAGTCQPEDQCAPAPCTGEGCPCATGTAQPCDDGAVATGGSRRLPTRRHRLVAAVLAIVVALAATDASPAQDAAEATPAAQGATQPAAQDTTQPTPSAEERLAQKHAPIAYLKRQAAPCDPNGEPYLPAPVEVVFGDPAVVLRQRPDGREIQRGVSASDLDARGLSHYLDLPGRPRRPGCGYERHFKARFGNQSPVVYAHVAAEEVEEGETDLALQYWFWYYFNDFNDKHEGDWEMIQLRFDAATAEAALTQEPVAVAFAQHKGGETADWDDPKLEKEGDRPVVYPSRGSHASYYGQGVWLGWGHAGSGLGCDDSTAPSVRIEPQVRLVPNDITDPNHPFAWAAFGGRWGERETWVYDGPKGPNLNTKWHRPITWQEGLRADSLRLQAAHALGPTPTDVFCSVVANGSEIFTVLQPHPWVLGGGALAVVGLGVWLLSLAWPILRAAAGVYARHLRTFAAIGGVLVPVSVAVNGFHYLLMRNAGFASWVDLSEDSPTVNAVMSLALGAQRAALLVLVGPAVIQAAGDIRAGRMPSFRRSYRVAFARLRTVIGAVAVVAIVATALAVTIVGIPVAALLAVRWAFVPQAVVLDGASWKGALGVSSRAVRGHWWRTALIGLVLAFVGAAVGPVVGIALMVLAQAPLDLANGASAVVYAFTHPFATVAATLLYWRLQAMPSAERRRWRFGAWPARGAARGPQTGAPLAR